MKDHLLNCDLLKQEEEATETVTVQALRCQMSEFSLSPFTSVNISVHAEQEDKTLVFDCLAPPHHIINCF